MKVRLTLAGELLDVVNSTEASSQERKEKITAILSKYNNSHLGSYIYELWKMDTVKVSFQLVAEVKDFENPIRRYTSIISNTGSNPEVVRLMINLYRELSLYDPTLIVEHSGFPYEGKANEYFNRAKRVIEKLGEVNTTTARKKQEHKYLGIRLTEDYDFLRDSSNTYDFRNSDRAHSCSWYRAVVLA